MGRAIRVGLAALVGLTLFSGQPAAAQWGFGNGYWGGPGFSFSLNHPTFGVRLYNYVGNPFYGGGVYYGPFSGYQSVVYGPGVFPYSGWTGGLNPGFGGFNPLVVDLPPRVIQLPRIGHPHPRPGSPGGSGFYLEQPRADAPAGTPARPAEPKAGADPAKPRPDATAPKADPTKSGAERPAPLTENPVLAGLRVTAAEKDSFLVSWTGPTPDLVLIELRAVDSSGVVLGSRVLKEPPFRGVLRVPDGTTHVSATVEYAGGTSASVRVTLERFRALARD